MKAAESKRLYRVLDANFNRAKEALRVAEDLSRFILNSKPLSASFKKVRHDLSRCLLTFPVPYVKLLASRDSREDVAKDSAIRDTRRKPDWRDLMIANLKRGQEALRVLEESAKVVSALHSKKFQNIRFQVYELEKRSILKF